MKTKLLLTTLLAAAVWRVNAADSWLTDLPAAQAEARAEHKFILVDFTGSDWCPACMEFEKKVLDSPEFQSYTAKNLVVLELDFPDKKPQTDALKKANAALKDKYNVEGYPTLLVLDQNGKEIGRQLGYDAKGPAAFIDTLEKIEAHK
jgi:protein disulfide-isomerase